MSRFKDIRETDWYHEPVAAAQKYGLIRGFEDGTFRPAEKITREQAMSILAQAMALTNLETPGASAVRLEAFADAEQIAEWAVEGVIRSLNAGIVAGRTETQLAPKAFITRAEAVVIIQRLLQKSGLI